MKDIELINSISDVVIIRESLAKAMNSILFCGRISFKIFGILVYGNHR